MAQQTIGLGTIDDDGTGDTLKVAGAKINDNFTEVYAGIGAEAIQDIVGAFVAAGKNVTVTYDDAGNALTITAPAVHPGYVAGRWYQGPAGGYLGNGAALATAKIYLYPFRVHQRITISDLCAKVAVIAAGGNFQLAVYGNDATNLPTGNALAAIASISTAIAGVLSADITGADVALPIGLYWGATAVDATAGGTVRMLAFDLGNSQMQTDIGSATLADMAGGGYVRVDSTTYGTWPDLTSATRNTISLDNKFALVGFKVASVP